MKDVHHKQVLCGCCRRDFLHTAGMAAGAVAGLFASAIGAETSQEEAPAPKKLPAPKKGTVTVLGAFVYPPSESLRKKEYWSAPGVDFDAEGRQKQYMARIREMEKKLGMRISMEEKALDSPTDVAQFISKVKQAKPDGLLLIPFYKGHWSHVMRIFGETEMPTVVLATLGVLLGPRINQLYRAAGAYLITSLDDLDAVEYGMRMINTARRMRESRIISIAGPKAVDYVVPGIGTQVRVLPLSRYYDEIERTPVTAEVRQLAQTWKQNAKEIIEPSEEDLVTAARMYFLNKRILEDEKGDAIMMNCLQRGRFLPCMSYMHLRDHGTAAGCQNDLDATLTMMLLLHLFDRPGFMGNAGMDTVNNLYHHAHCTSASKLNGTGTPSEPYILRDFAHSGLACVPEVLLREGQEVTMAHYLHGKTPQMLVYTGTVVKNCHMPPAGGCRTNVTMTINEVEDVCDVKGMHQTVIYGNYARQLRAFCQLYGITVVT